MQNQIDNNEIYNENEKERAFLISVDTGDFDALVSIKELDFDENDTLSAIVAALCGADLLVILTDVDGLYDKNPKLPGAKLIPEVKQITSEMISSAKDKGSEFASGGMITKLEAATIAKEHGIPTVIINGQRPEILYDLFENKAVCTVFTADED